MQRTESVLIKTWCSLGLVKTKRVSVDTTGQPKNIAYPTNADLLHRIRAKIFNQVQKVRRQVALRKPFRTFTRVSKNALLQIKKFYRKQLQKQKQAVKELLKIFFFISTFFTGGVNDVAIS